MRETKKVNAGKEFKREGAVYYGIVSTSKSHWGRGQTGITLFENGEFRVSLNRPIHGRYPTHRDLGNGYPAILSFGYAADYPSGTIWLYPDTERNIEKLKKALVNMIGHFGIDERTKVYSNTTRKFLFTLGKLKEEMEKNKCLAAKYLPIAKEDVRRRYDMAVDMYAYCTYESAYIHRGFIFPDGSVLEIGENDHHDVFTEDFWCKMELTRYRYEEGEMYVAFVCGVDLKQILTLMQIIKTHFVVNMIGEVYTRDYRHLHFELRRDEITIERIYEEIEYIKRRLQR